MRMGSFQCEKCRFAICVIGTDTQIGTLRTDPAFTPMLCVRGQCSGRMEYLTGVVVGAKEVPAEVFFRAMARVVSIDDKAAPRQRVDELLLGRRITAVQSSSAGMPERTILHTLTLEGGVQLHLESSGYGACVYYVEDPQNDLVASEGDSPHSTENRSEGGLTGGSQQGSSSG